jgi:predicted RNA binding protein YcfA (HicA-like mRNA interferase family)
MGLIVRLLSACAWHDRFVAKARNVRRAIERAGWELMRVRGSHRIYRKGSLSVPFAYHDAVDLGGPAMAIVAREFGMSVSELRRLL